MTHMSENLQLFIELMSARSAHEVRTALDDYAQALAGGQLSDLPSRYVGARENNRGPVEVMESAENSAYEKIMNGFDALIELRQHLGGFTTAPINARKPSPKLATISTSPAFT